MAIKIMSIASASPMCGIHHYAVALKEAFDDLSSGDVVEILPFYLNKYAPFRSYARAFLKILEVRPHIVHLQHELVIYDTNKGVTSPILMGLLRLASLLSQVKIVTTLHTVFSLQQLDRYIDPVYSRTALHLAAAKRSFWLLTVSAAKASHRCIVLTDQAMDVLVRDYGISVMKVKHIFHGVPGSLPISGVAEPRDIRREFSCEGKKIVSLLGYFYPNKGFHVVLEAIPEIIIQQPNVAFFFIGHSLANHEPSRRYYEQLQRRVKEMGLERQVFFTGYLNFYSMAALLEETSLFIFPYFERISASGAVHLAVRAKKPIITTNIMLFADLIRRGIAVPFPSMDRMDMVKTIVKALNMEAAELQRVRVAAEEYMELFSMKNAAKKHIEVYREICDS